MLKLYREAGFDTASSHSGRRSFATNCIWSGVGIVSLKTLMNHASIQQTSEYVATNEDMETMLKETITDLNEVKKSLKEIEKNSAGS